MPHFTVTVIEESLEATIENAQIFVDGKKRGTTNESGQFGFNLGKGKHSIKAEAFGVTSDPIDVAVPKDTDVNVLLDLQASLEARTEDFHSEIKYCRVGDVVGLRANIQGGPQTRYRYSWDVPGRSSILELDEDQDNYDVHWDTGQLGPGPNTATVTITDASDESGSGAVLATSVPINIRSGSITQVSRETSLIDSVREVAGQIQTTRESGVTVDMERTRRKGTPEILTWNLIRRTTNALEFGNYKAFMDLVLCNDDKALQTIDEAETSLITGLKSDRFRDLQERRFLPYTDTDAYRLLKTATEAFLIVNCGVPLEGFISQTEYEQLLNQLDAEDVSGTTAENWWEQYQVQVNGTFGPVLPYFTLILNKLPDVPIKRRIFANLGFNGADTDEQAEACYGILLEKLLQPCMIELIWSYWQEEGMLVQTMNAISRRFQNVRGPAARDPLAMVETDPLRPLNNLLWGYVQDEQHRLSVVRRAYEYNHHYGLTLDGEAVRQFRPADSRSRFLEAFHQLLHLASIFYKQDDDTTMIADGFALLNALRDVHMVLSEGAHNQYGDLPSTARIEMLMQQWLLARPEFREMLPTRVMVAYPEPWMDRVDAMKRLQGWGDASATHFRFLAMFGEEILLSIRFTRWSEIENAELAALWARFFRNEVLGYIHAYRAVTGVDLTAEATMDQQRAMLTAQPSVLLRQRLQAGAKRPQLITPVAKPLAFRERRGARS